MCNQLHDINGIIKEARKIIRSNLQQNPTDHEIDEIVGEVNDFLSDEHPAVPFRATKIHDDEKVNIFLQSGFRLN